MLETSLLALLSIAQKLSTKYWYGNILYEHTSDELPFWNPQPEISNQVLFPQFCQSIGNKEENDCNESEEDWQSPFLPFRHPRDISTDDDLLQLCQRQLHPDAEEEAKWKSHCQITKEHGDIGEEVIVPWVVLEKFKLSGSFKLRRGIDQTWLKKNQ